MIRVTLAPDDPAAVGALEPELPARMPGAYARAEGGAVTIEGASAAHVRALTHTVLRLLEAADLGRGR